MKQVKNICLVLLGLSIVLMNSCSPKNEFVPDVAKYEDFLMTSTISTLAAGEVVYSIDNNTDQIVVSDDAKTYSFIHNDGYELFNVSLSNVPALGVALSADYTNENGTVTIAGEVVNIISGRVYVWDERTSTGIIIPYIPTLN